MFAKLKELGAGSFQDLNMQMAIKLMQAAKYINEVRHHKQMMEQMIIALLVRGFPNGVSITAKEVRQSMEYELYTATDSDDVATLRARPRVLREPSHEGGLDDDDLHGMLDAIFGDQPDAPGAGKPRTGDDAE